MAVTDQQFAALERKVAELERYIEERKVQQIRFPLDSASQTVIKNL